MLGCRLSQLNANRLWHMFVKCVYVGQCRYIIFDSYGRTVHTTWGGVTSAESNVVASDWLHMLRLSLCR